MRTDSNTEDTEGNSKYQARDSKQIRGTKGQLQNKMDFRIRRNDRLTRQSQSLHPPPAGRWLPPDGAGPSTGAEAIRRDIWNFGDIGTITD